MRRATTPTHSFTLPFDSSMVSRFLLTYQQRGQTVLEKTEDDMTVEGNTWSVKLTQEETKLFSPALDVTAQIRILTPGEDALASDTMKLRVKPVLNDEVLA